MIKIPYPANTPQRASANEAPAPVASPIKAPNEMAFRMQSTIAGPTGTARRNPMIKPLKKRKNKKASLQGNLKEKLHFPDFEIFEKLR